ncbi:thioredoxin family protein [Oceanobacillus senegalensis]|uniref:thioredoxin family protein n=1 Tax=Oceanobacillus senegalensis TaxID=1936063 RepID=UPI000A3050D4|nr:thioredoxin family protein [Oceanobacillus senegalensis]
MELNQWFDKAISAETYIKSMKTNKEGLQYIYNQFVLPDDEVFFEKVKAKNLRAIVLTEDWCGDAMLNVPILLKLSEKANIEVRMLLRDQNLELMDQYLTNGKSRSIPIFIFIDENGNEIAKWGPRAKEVQQFVDDSRNTLPSKDADDFQEKTKELYGSINKTFQENSDFWTNVYESLKERLS